MGDGRLCWDKARPRPKVSTERSLLSRRWLEEAQWLSSTHSQGPQKDKRILVMPNVPFVPEENAWDSADETCAQGRAPSRPAPGHRVRLRAAPSPPPWPWAADWLTSSFSGSGSLTPSPALPGRVLPEHSTSLTSARLPGTPPRGSGTARLPGASHLPPPARPCSE